MAEYSAQAAAASTAQADIHRSITQERVPAESSTTWSNDETERLIEVIKQSLVGQYASFSTPFGRRPVVYADWTASGRALSFIERFIQRQVLPFYANTHTTQSVTGLQSTNFRDEARHTVARAVNAQVLGPEATDVVLFTGFGTTAAVNKFVHALGMHLPLPHGYSSEDRPVVFTSAYEHHSNLLPWRESSAEIVTVAYSADTGVDLEDLRCKLAACSQSRLKIGAFSAASNITGILTDTDSVARIMHTYGGLAVFDYATAAPYVQIDMNPTSDDGLAYKDAIFMSTHKFVGGPGATGILVVKKRLMLNPVPTSCGGGTVFFVTDNYHRYLSDTEEREEAGTPNILGDIRAGLAFHLKSQLGATKLERLEHEVYLRFRTALCSNTNVVLLGHEALNSSSHMHPRHLPIFSFLIRHGERFLHYNFVCAILNDLFGIQTRGGCQCAGPFGRRILGLSVPDTLLLDSAMLDRQFILKAGFTRLSVPFFIDPAEERYLLNAIHFVADHGWLFLPWYRCDPETGTWIHRAVHTPLPEQQWLVRLPFDVIAEVGRSKDEQEPCADAVSCLREVWEVGSREELFDKIWRLALCAKALAAKTLETDISSHEQFTAIESESDWIALQAGLQPTDAQIEADYTISDPVIDYEELRWFVYPHETSRSAGQMDPPLVMKGPLQPLRADWWSKADPTAGVDNLPTARPPQTDYGRRKATEVPIRVVGKAQSDPPLFSRPDFRERVQSCSSTGNWGEEGSKSWKEEISPRTVVVSEDHESPSSRRSSRHGRRRTTGLLTRVRSIFSFRRAQSSSLTQVN